MDCIICVTSVSYSIIINGKPTGNIMLSRGIRQMDSLFSCLFFICAEALSFLLHRAEIAGVITCVPITKQESMLNHLFCC